MLTGLATAFLKTCLVVEKFEVACTNGAAVNVKICLNKVLVFVSVQHVVCFPGIDDGWPSGPVETGVLGSVAFTVVDAVIAEPEKSSTSGTVELAGKSSSLEFDISGFTEMAGVTATVVCPCNEMVLVEIGGLLISVLTELLSEKVADLPKRPALAPVLDANTGFVVGPIMTINNTNIDSDIQDKIKTFDNCSQLRELWSRG